MDAPTAEMASHAEEAHRRSPRRSANSGRRGDAQKGVPVSSSTHRASHLRPGRQLQPGRHRRAQIGRIQRIGKRLGQEEGSQGQEERREEPQGDSSRRLHHRIYAGISRSGLHHPGLSLSVFRLRAPDHPTHAHGDMKPYREVKQSLRRRFPPDYKGSDSSSAVANARLAGRMLAGAVNSELEGSVCKCGFICDTEFGCDQCIPPDLYAVPAECSDDVTSAKVLHIDWIADTGSAEDLLRDSTLPDQHGYMSDRPIKLLTANGESSSQKQGKVFIPELGRTIDPYLVRDTPAVLSVGMRCMNDGHDFIWKSAGQKPYFVRKDRTRIPLEVRDYVPYLVAKHKEGTVALPATDGGREGKLFVEDAPTRSSPSSSSKGDGYIIEAPVEADTSAGRDAAPLPRDERTDPDGSIAAKERKGAEQLRAEATSVAHQLSHFPKNPFCEVCIKAKMFKPPSRRTGGSRQVKAEKFGDHLTADFLITRGEEEHGMDGEKSSLVIKDVATGFIAVYPSARRTIEEIVRSLQHFVGPNEKVGIFYSDNAPELVAAIKQLQWRHVLDVPYISQTNAVAERAIRSVLEGTRVNLMQAGLHHSYWPHAARHWCHMSNVLSRDGQPSPWKLRFNESFPGTLIPFGTKVEFWIGPRLKPKEDLRFEPSTNPGVFMGYALHPGCMWRKEFLCIPLKALMDRPFDDPIKPLRTNQIEKPSKIRFPNRLRYNAIREGATSLEDLSNPVEYVGAPEAEGVDPPKIIEDKSTADGAELDPHEANISRTAGSVLDEGWLAFLASVNTKVGWYVFAECHVHVAGGSSKAEELFDKADPASVPYRTTVCRAGSGYYVLMANEIVDPPTSDEGVDHGVQELIVTIYSPGEITIRREPKTQSHQEALTS